MINCCEMMNKMTVAKWSTEKKWETSDLVIFYNEVFDEYGIIVHDGGQSYIMIHYCPWCGIKLPKSKRNQWFDELEELGFENPFEDEIPNRYRTKEWRINSGKSE
ncbi:MAG: hypothetical protein RR565_06620 [Erysipelothrix sp.]